MPIPVVAYYAAAAAAGAYLLFRKKPAITARGEGVTVPPAPVLPPPPAGQPIPPGFVQLPSGNITQAFAFGSNAFSAASDPDNLANPQFSQPGALLVGDCITIDIGASGLAVEGVASGNLLFKVVDPMDGTNGIKASPVDPRLPPGQPDMVLPKAAITGGGEC